MQSWGVEHYLRGGRGGIYSSSGERQVPPMALLAELDGLGYGDYKQFWATRASEVGIAALTSAVDRVPDEWMSQMARAFAKAILQTQFDQLAGGRLDD